METIQKTSNGRTILVSAVMLILVLGSCSGGILLGRFFPIPGLSQPTAATTKLQTESSAPTSTATSTTDLEKLFVPFWEAWKLVHKEYFVQPVDDVSLMQGAIRGMLEALGDKHTSYMDPEDFNQLNVRQSGEYEGIGAWVDSTSDFLTIISPMSGYPAEKAGLRTGDLIIAVDGEDMTGVDPQLVLKKVLGPAGSTVKLTIKREGMDPFDVSVVREKINVPSATGKMLDNNIAYVQINTFGDSTTAELKKALKDLMANHPVGLIVDLRGNGGGYLQTAIEVVSQFIAGDKIAMYEEYGDGKREALSTLPGGLATDIPLVVLVDEGTASASEITAGAIQDYKRGLLVGVKTYGKGSVQALETLSGNQGAVKITIAHWLTPNGRLIHEIGLTPDYVVELTEEDIAAKRDAQLLKAIDLLLNK